MYRKVYLTDKNQTNFSLSCMAIKNAFMFNEDILECETTSELLKVCSSYVGRNESFEIIRDNPFKTIVAYKDIFGNLYYLVCVKEEK